MFTGTFGAIFVKVQQLYAIDIFFFFKGHFKVHMSASIRDKNSTLDFGNTHPLIFIGQKPTWDTSS